ncbi:hypothetical protein SUNI508_12809 [Seiridium unicorne]|uniref:Transmembrane protein n=1 Tax=Seiridium unicorne TaxID=138068 RepID=A0ABR2VGL7_9PEZI
MSSFLDVRDINNTAAGHGSSTEEKYEVPLVGTILSIVVAIISLTLLSAFFAIRVTAVTAWNRLPLVSWVILAIYINSWIFVSIATILRWGPGINEIWAMCSAAIFLCLSCYFSTKLIYFFLVEKAFVVWGGPKKRLESKLYIFNTFVILAVFGGIGICFFIFRITKLDNGKCIIGIKRSVLISLLVFDSGVNLYLTVLFLIPLRNSYSFNMDKTSGNPKLRDLVIRTFIGAVTSSVTSLLNIAVMLALNDETGWVCLISCNLDLLFDAIIVQYATSRDNKGTQTTSPQKSLSVSVEKSIAVFRSENRSANEGGSKWGATIDLEEEEIGMSRLGAAPAGSSMAIESFRPDFACDRSAESKDELELGNRTDVVVTAKNLS